MMMVSNKSKHYTYLLYFKVVEVVIPEIVEMRTAHLVSIGSECLSSLNPDIEDGYV